MDIACATARLSRESTFGISSWMFNDINILTAKIRGSYSGFS